MKPASVAKTAIKYASDPFETLTSQVGKPVAQEALNELGGFFDGIGGVGRRPQAIAQEDLARARQEQKLKEMEQEDNKASQESAQALFTAIHNEYKSTESQTEKQQGQLKQEIVELQSEVVKLAKTAGVDTKAHLEPMPKRVGVIDIKRLTMIVRFLRMKAEDAKSAKEIVSQRSNAKRATGMMAWVSGKQMKIHEQGTLQLQG